MEVVISITFSLFFIKILVDSFEEFENIFTV